MKNNPIQPPASQAAEKEFPASWEGGHALVIEYGDCELYGRCQCGRDFGSATPDKSLDDFGMAWEKHVMTEVRR